MVSFLSVLTINSFGVDNNLRISNDLGSEVTFEFIKDGLSAYNINFRRNNGEHLYFRGKVESNLIMCFKLIDTDNYGDYEMISVKAPNKVFTFKLYRKDQVVRFSYVVEEAVELSSLAFPVFYEYSEFHQNKSFKRTHFSPIINNLEGDSPWIMFNNSFSTVILSPSDDFMNINNYWINGKEMSVGVNKEINEVKNRYSIESILVFAEGVNSAFDLWGSYLKNKVINLEKQNRISEDSLISELSYWTDNRASYWYNYRLELGYVDTIVKMISELKSHGFKIGQVQIDSWWYLKGPTGGEISWKNYKGGVFEFISDNNLFPNGINEFSEKLRLPLAAHSRWIDKDGKYAQKYKMSYQVSIDESFWEDIMQSFKKKGISTYEQDWLSGGASADLSSSDDSNMFTDLMAQKANKYDISIQYCMPLPKYFLQSLKYSNVITIRVSDDGFNRSMWTPFLFGSRFAESVGLSPFTDNVFSSDLYSLIIAVLSKGPVGLGDSLTEEGHNLNEDYCSEVCNSLNVSNLSKAVVGNGKIAKPDKLLLPTDSSYIDSSLVLSSSHTYDDNMKNVLSINVFSYSESQEVLSFNRSIIDPDSQYVVHQFPDYKLIDSSILAAEYSGSYHIYSYLFQNSFALLGDISLITPMSKQRQLVTIIENGIQVQVNIYEGESKISLKVFYKDITPKVQSDVHISIVPIDSNHIIIEISGSGKKIIKLSITTN